MKIDKRTVAIVAAFLAILGGVYLMMVRPVKVTRQTNNQARQSRRQARLQQRRSSEAAVCRRKGCTDISAPLMRNRLPRLPISTPRRSSIWRRCSSNGPDRLARRSPSSGASAMSRCTLASFMMRSVARSHGRDQQSAMAIPRGVRVRYCMRGPVAGVDFSRPGNSREF